MPFLLYRKTKAESQIRYERLKMLRLGGPDGLIARYVKAMPADQTASWSLDAAAVLQLDGHSAGNLAVLFDASGGGTSAACLYELTRIHGSCRDTSTNLALDFNVILDGPLDESHPDFAAAFAAPADAKPKQLGEILALTGGPAGGDWKWGSSALQIGATVVQPHQSAPGCPNCACGRQAAPA